MMLLLTIINSK